MKVLKAVSRLAAVNAALAFAITIVFGGGPWTVPWRETVESFFVSFLFATCIGPLCFMLIPRLAPFVASRVSTPVYWTGLVAAMAGLAAVGSLMALFILSAVGYLATSEILRAWLASSLKISITVTLVVGVTISLYETMRARLDQATLALRTKERDEADAQRLAAEAQLASLESRVRPHFLFNTLNSIAALIPQDPAGAEKVTGQLASLLRSSLDTQSSPLVPLEQEIEIVRNYLEIEQVRFGDRLRYQIHVADIPLSTLIPRLALQTLVENSVKYAVAPRREGGAVSIVARNGAAGLRLEVRDDGPGFDGTEVLPGHGLALVRDRLNLTLGGRSRLVIDGRPGQTVVAIEVVP